MTVTLDSIEATLESLQADNQREHDRIMAQLLRMNGQVRENTDDSTRLKEQSIARTGALGVLYRDCLGRGWLARHEDVSG